jgi:guanylate kinase
MKKGSLYIISAPSGAGKSSLIRRILRERENTLFSVSYTTRPPRGREVNGKDYFFVSEDKFLKMIEENLFFEYAKVHNYYYGTEKTFILNNLQKGNDVILDIDYQGAQIILNNFKNITYNVVTIFILPPSYKELRDRLERRGTDKKETIELRLKNAVKEMENCFFYDYVIVNKIFKKAYYDLLSIFRSNSLKTINSKDKIKNILLKYKEELNGKSNN